MFLFKSVSFYFVCAVIVAIKSLDETTQNDLEDELSTNDTSDLNIVESIKLLQPNPKEKVNVKLYYESLCPYCRDFGQRLKIYAEELHEYIDVQLYPYGNARTSGTYSNYIFDCQHGEEECYGNKLHACAIDVLGNITQAVIYTSCMMDPEREDDDGSTDAAADECAVQLSIDSEPIKSCAKSKKGSRLLKYYGDETDKANIYGVPHILINGVKTNNVDFPSDLLSAISAIVPSNLNDSTTPTVILISSQHVHNANYYLPIAMTLTWLLKCLEWF